MHWYEMKRYLWCRDILMKHFLHSVPLLVFISCQMSYLQLNRQILFFGLPNFILSANLIFFTWNPWLYAAIIHVFWLKSFQQFFCENEKWQIWITSKQWKSVAIPLHPQIKKPTPSMWISIPINLTESLDFWWQENISFYSSENHHWKIVNKFI